MPEPADLEVLSSQPEGILHVYCKEASSLLHHLRSEKPGMPSALCGKPLLLEIRLAAAPQLRYRMWACWLPPDTTLQPNLLPLHDFRMGLTPRRRSLPMLMLARAEGRFEIPPMWDPRLSHLLNERGPTHSADGRLLLLASPEGPEPWCASTQLARAISLYFASLSDGGQTVLPEGCFLVRSGQCSLLLEASPRVRVFAAQIIPQASAKARGLSPKPSLLPPGLTLECRVSGQLLWGAWRGDAAKDGSVVSRFVTQTCRADKATTLEFRANSLLSSAEWQTLADAIFAREVTPPAAVSNSEAADTEAIAGHVSRQLLKAVESDGRLARARKIPYFLLYQENSPVLITMGEASKLPEKYRFPGGDGGSRATAEFVSFPELISRQRDLQLSLPHNLRLDGSQPRTSLAEGPKPSATLPTRNRTTSQAVSKKPSLADLLLRSQKVVLAQSEREPTRLYAHFEWTQSPKLMLALLPEIAAWARRSWPPPAAVQASLREASSLRCKLEAELVMISHEADHKRLPRRLRGSSMARSVVAASQTALRALLAASVCNAAQVCVDTVWSRALLVYRYGRILPPPDNASQIADPRGDDVLSATVHSAMQGLKRISRPWQQMLLQPSVRAQILSSREFAQIQVSRALANPFHLRKILMEEQALCETLAEFAAYSATNTPDAGQAGISEHDAERTASALNRAAHRIYPGGAAAELLPLLVLNACGAAITGKGRGGLRIRCELTAVRGLGSTEETLHLLPSQSTRPYVPFHQAEGRTRAA